MPLTNPDATQLTMDALARFLIEDAAWGIRLGLPPADFDGKTPRDEGPR